MPDLTLPRKFFDDLMFIEIGPAYKPYEPAVMFGYCDTPEQKRAVGYTNNPVDRGGETKFGIAANSHPGMDIRDLNLADAITIYDKEYWHRGLCYQMISPIAYMHFDACINHGVLRANMLLQRALDLDDDGILGKVSMNALKAIDNSRPELTAFLGRLALSRKAFMRKIVENNPSQAVFINGWLNRVDRVMANAARLPECL